MAPPVPAVAQTEAALGVGAGTVRTETGSSFSAASLAPSARYATPRLVVQGSGLVASLPGGAWANQGRLYVWATTPRVEGPFRFGVEGILAGASRTGGTRTSEAHGLGEVLWSRPGWGLGVGAGPSTGWISNDSTRFVALHTRARAWWRPRAPSGVTELQVSVEPTRFVGAWFTDLGTSVALRRGPATLSLSADARLSSAYQSTGAGSGSLQLAVGPHVSLELGGGSYLRDPYQGYPRGRFLSFGLRVASPGAVNPAPAPDEPRPLVLAKRGDSVVVRFRFRGVQSVAIAGDWDGWQRHGLRPARGNVWNGSFNLAPGRYRFALLVDNRTWVVPSGVATVPGRDGGAVAVLVVR